MNKKMLRTQLVLLALAVSSLVLWREIVDAVLPVSVACLLVGLQFGNGISANLIGIANQTFALATIVQISAGYAIIMAVGAINLGATARRTAKTTTADRHMDLPILPASCLQHGTKRNVA